MYVVTGQHFEIFVISVLYCTTQEEKLINIYLKFIINFALFNLDKRQTEKINMVLKYKAVWEIMCLQT